MTYIHEDWLLQNEIGKRLYHETAKHLPIIDYHNHLSPEDIYKDRHYQNLTEIWLEGDHYKWRAMRASGVEEKNITGNTSDWEKFSTWADTVSKLIGNPVYHWTHLELYRYFGEDRLLNRQTKEDIYLMGKQKLQDGSLSTKKILEKEKVVFLGTTDDPADSLNYHRLLEDEAALTAAPSFRPDIAMKTESPAEFNEWIKRLEAASGKTVERLEDFLAALKDRIAYFKKHGCRASDHGLAQIPSKKISEKKASLFFNKVKEGEPLTLEEQDGFRYFILSYLAGEYKQAGWVMQFHIGPLRNTNSVIHQKIGADSGGDSMRNGVSSTALHEFLNELNTEGNLPKTILYSLNPNDYPVLAAAAGSFQSSETAGKVQVGSAWWFNDHIDGIQQHLRTLSSIGSIYSFVGMLTDSRSILSMSRHDFFRRILCNEFGKWVLEGKAPADETLLKDYVKKISYENAADYFQIKNKMGGSEKNGNEFSMVRKK